MLPFGQDAHQDGREITGAIDNKCWEDQRHEILKLGSQVIKYPMGAYFLVGLGIN